MEDYGRQWLRWDRAVERKLACIETDRRILPENKELIKSFVTYLTARGSKSATIWRHVYSFGKLLDAFDSSVKILEATRDEVVGAVAKIEKLDLGTETKVKIRITLKFLFKHYKGEDLYYPKEVAWIKTTVKKESKIAPGDLLTEDEIDRMLENALNFRDVAIIALLADAPIRTHELLLLKRKHLVIDAPQPYIVIPEGTKTGTRRIPLINSVPYLVQYLNVMKQIRPDDPLFLHELWNKERRAFGYEALRMMLKKVAERAGVKKRVYPYLFRHSVVTRYANKLSNAQLEKIAGWTHGTDMHMRYEHLSDGDISNAVAKANGVKVVEEHDEVKPRVKLCGRCNYTNARDSIYCARCGGALSIGTAMQEEKDKSLVEEAMARYLSDPKHFEELAHKVLTDEYKRKKG